MVRRKIRGINPGKLDRGRKGEKGGKGKGVRIVQRGVREWSEGNTDEYEQRGYIMKKWKWTRMGCICIKQ